jgi:hypothetical protein
MVMKLIRIDGYYNDDKTEFYGYLVSQGEEIIEERDDDIFFYGLTLDYIEANLGNENTGLDFTITDYNLENNC